MLAPQILWAQRTNEIFITIDLIDIENPQIKLTENDLYFQGRSDGKDYEVNLKFFNKIDPEASKQSVTARNIFFIIIKKEKEQPYWPRLLETKGKIHYLKTDFGRWKDEDDEDDDVANPMEGIDFSQFNGMGDMGGMTGMGGMAGMNDLPDSDDEEENSDEDLPNLESTTA